MCIRDSSDTSDVPSRFEHIVIARAKYYVALLRSDKATAAVSLQEYNDIIKRMRVELVNKKEYLRAV